MTASTDSSSNGRSMASTRRSIQGYGARSVSRRFALRMNSRDSPRPDPSSTTDALPSVYGFIHS